MSEIDMNERIAVMKIDIRDATRWDIVSALKDATFFFEECENEDKIHSFVMAGSYRVIGKMEVT